MSIRSFVLRNPRRLLVALLPLAIAACSTVPPTDGSPPATTAPPVTTVPAPTTTVLTTPPASGADLVVLAGATGATKITPGSTFRPTVQVANQGGTDVSNTTIVGVAITLDDLDLNNPEAWSDTQLGLKAGTSVSPIVNGGPNAGLVTAPAGLGDHTLSFDVDNPFEAVGPTGRVLEAQENNNSLTIHFQVVASDTPTTTVPTPTTTVPTPTTTVPPPTTTVPTPTTTVPTPTTTVPTPTTTVPTPTTTVPTPTTTVPPPPSGTTNAKASFGFYPRYGNLSGLAQIESAIGRKATHIVQFTDISSPSAMVQSAWGELVAPGMFQTRAGISKMVLSIPLAFKNQTARLQDTINGVNDSSFVTVANYLVGAGHPDAVLRLGWEFDGDWMPWAAPGQEAKFIAAFRHVHDVFKSVSSRFRYDFNGTTGVDGWKTTWEASYPGDAYVDIIGGDAYDRGPAVLSKLPAALKKQRDMAIAHGKQISWPEWGLGSGGTAGGEGDNVAYIQAMADFMNSSPASGPGSVAYHAYFNEDVPDGTHTITSFPNSYARFKTLFGA